MTPSVYYMINGKKNIRILIVEDELIQMLLLKKFYEELNCTVIGSATSADGAIEAALKEKPDIISMDIFLEGPQDGINAMEIIKKHENIPVIYITGNSDEYHLNRAKKTGFAAYLTKPATLPDIEKAIQSVVNDLKNS